MSLVDGKGIGDDDRRNSDLAQGLPVGKLQNSWRIIHPTSNYFEVLRRLDDDLGSLISSYYSCFNDGLVQ